MNTAILILLPTALAFADGAGRIESRFTSTDFELTADPSASQWKSVAPVMATLDRYGKPVQGHRTEIRSRWSKEYLYVLFVCPYEQLYLIPNPSTARETNKLWEYDVAEMFIGADLQNINVYREFQVSPQGEWVDLAIDRTEPPKVDWTWNAPTQVKARIDKAKKVWYGEMKIPFRAIDASGPTAGKQLRVNFYRIQGPMPDRVHINWQVVNAPSYHTPQAFGRMVLGK